MQFLMGSSNALADRYAFMKFQVFQWLIGATDGHAKNFSVFIERGGSYRLTPFYDIISVFTSMGGNGLNIRDLKLAMSLKASKGRKNQIDKIFPRHFLATAKQVNFDQNQMIEILDFFRDEMGTAIRRVAITLPVDFPMSVADSLFENSLSRIDRLRR
jgi:serine/threonine-protein kinase HipA